MESPQPPPYVGLPAASLAGLADACVALGEGGIGALREAGRRGGARLHDDLGEDAGARALGDFWSRVAGAIRRLHLGSVDFRPLDEGLAAVRWADLPEAGADQGGGRRTAGCHLATGILAGLLARAAGRPVPVLEVACAASGSGSCLFLLGPEERLARVRDRLAAGASLAAAVRRN